MKRIVVSFLFFIVLVPVQAQSGDSAQVRKTIMDFYGWYVKNHSRLNSFELYRGMQKKDAPPFRIDWVEVDRYFAYIRSSVPWLGEAFIARQKIFFKQCDSAFRVETGSEIPYGFDFDWYTESQEHPGWRLDELERATRWKVVVDGDQAEVDVWGIYNDNGTPIEAIILCYSMRKEKESWKIARVGCPYSKY